MTKTVYCDTERKDTDHTAEVDKNSEIVLSCNTKDCNHFIKLPAGMTTDQIKSHLTEYKEQNSGDIILTADLEKQKAEALQALEKV